MSLEERLRARIAEGPLTVRDFMRAALYDPEEGYYARGPAIGAEGDFYTASNVSLFPHALARFVKAASERLGGARVVELGGGTGELAAHLGAEVTIVEPSAGLAAAQKERGLRVVRDLAELSPATTIFLANEVLDALPAHRVLGSAEGPREGHVIWRDGAFRETAGPLSRPELAIDVPEGASVEVHLDAAPLLAAMSAAAPRFLALFLDYAAGPPRAGGTLRGFAKHRVTDPFLAPGTQDITADVEFARIAALAKEAGLDVLGERAQGEFLADLGLLDDMMAALARGDNDAYLAGKNLLMPTGMGERFRALCVGRGVPSTPPLPGFRTDVYPGASRR